MLCTGVTMLRETTAVVGTRRQPRGLAWLHPELPGWNRILPAPIHLLSWPERDIQAPEGLSALRLLLAEAAAAPSRAGWRGADIWKQTGWQLFPAPSQLLIQVNGL